MNKATNEVNESVGIENRMRIIANLIIDRILSMTPEEREKLDKKIRYKPF